MNGHKGADRKTSPIVAEDSDDGCGECQALELLKMRLKRSEKAHIGYQTRAIDVGPDIAVPIQRTV